jgi:serine/threonine-protein kinase SRPK3
MDISMKMVGMTLSSSTQSLMVVLFAGKLLHIDRLSGVSLEQAVICHGLPEAEVPSAVEFIRACLHLDPEERSSAADLDAHPWLEKAYMCS